MLTMLEHCLLNVDAMPFCFDFDTGSFQRLITANCSVFSKEINVACSYFEIVLIRCIKLFLNILCVTCFFLGIYVVPPRLNNFVI